jgi:hypothetical protein
MFRYFAAQKEIAFQGLFIGNTLTAASVDERDALWEMIESIRGVLFGDKGYIRPMLKTELATQGIQLETPLRKNMNDTRDRGYVKRMNTVRRRIETVIGQLSEHFGIKRVWERDLWHMTNRLIRNFLLIPSVFISIGCKAMSRYSLNTLSQLKVENRVNNYLFMILLQYISICGDITCICIQLTP